MRTIFIDDKEPDRNNMRLSLSEFKQLQLVGEADSVESGYDLILKEKPDLVVADIELYPGTAFDLLNKLLEVENKIHFEVIFVTAFANFEYPIRAIQYAALDFIMKPLDRERVKEAIERAERKLATKNSSNQYLEQIQTLLQNIKNPTERKSNRIAFHRAGGKIEFVTTDEIIYCEAEKDYTHVYLKDGKKFTAIRNLLYYSRPLEIDFNFFRISDKHLVNLDYLKLYEHSEDFQLTLTNGKVLNASRRGGQQLKEHINSSR